MKNIMKKTVLVVENNVHLCNVLKKWLQRAGYSVVIATGEFSAKQKVVDCNIELILSEVHLLDGNGIKFFEWCIRHGFNVPFVIMKEYTSVPDVVRAIKMGVTDYLLKPIYENQLLDLFNNIFEHSTIENRCNKLFPRCSPAILKTERLACRVAISELSVIILGPNGSGKESIALTIHNNSSRKNKPFVAVNCGCISKDLVASEFFGHVKGAYTGAENNTIGYLGTACGGTLFLDEIGNMSMEMQILLLRVLQEKVYSPVGSCRICQADVRILSATNEDIHCAIKEGRFREDLYHRLAEFEIYQPALSDCLEDILPLADFFRKQYSEEIKVNTIGFSDKAKFSMLAYTWPGNIRELKNRVKRAVILSDIGILTDEDLGLNYEKLNKDKQIKILEKETIASVLKESQGNISDAAKKLGVSRPTLYKKINFYGLNNGVDDS